MRTITIAASPRTGSTLLMLSLAQHPLAICGGEWLDPNLHLFAPDAWHRKQAGIHCNLVKVFGHQSQMDGFDALLAGSFVVNLYRRDKQAQIASWRTACETGRWTAEQPLGAFPWEFPENVEELIRAGDELASRAAVSYAYEHMIDHWDQVIEEILTGAGWPLQSLPKALQKQSG